MGLNRSVSSDTMTQGTSSSSSCSDDDRSNNVQTMISPTSTSRTRKGFLSKACSSESSKSISNSPPSNLLSDKETASTSTTPLSSASSNQHSDANFEMLCNKGSGKCRLSRSSTVPFDLRLAGLVTTPTPLRLNAWSEPCATGFKVRDTGYVANRSKKAPSLESVFHLLTVDIVQSIGRPNYSGMCAYPTERIQLALENERLTKTAQLPEFVFAVNLCIPASCAASSNTEATSKAKQNSYYHVVFYFGLNNIDMIKDMNTPLGRVAYPFFFGGTEPKDNEYRDRTFKLIPRIVDGNFVVRKAVGTKPSILGSKVKQHYIVNDRYFEVIVDISSDMIANQIVKLALGYSKNLGVDMMFLLEGHDETMLPERILGGVKMQNIDFKNNHDAPRSVQPMP